MNRLHRHEMARRTFIDKHSAGAGDSRWIKAATKAPFDVTVFRPNGATGVRTIFFEIKTWSNRRTFDLSPHERAFGKWAEYHGSPYVVVLCRVKGEQVLSEEFHRPLVEFAPMPTMEGLLA